MFYLFIPPIIFTILLFLNMQIKTRRFNVSNTLLIFLLVSFVSAAFLARNPLSGETFINLPAILFLSFCFLMITFPVIFLKDYPDIIISKTIPPDKLKQLVWGLLFFLLPAAIYASSNILLIRDFFYADMTKNEFGQMHNIQVRGNFFLMYVYCAMSLSFPCLFLSIYSWNIKQINSFTRILLLFCGFTPGLQGIHIMSRSALINCVLFLLATVLVLFPSFPKKEQKRLIKLTLLVLGLIMIPLFIISWIRFKGEVLYWTFGYFCDGPYSFGIFHYAACNLKLMPQGGGMYSFPYFVEILNKVFDIPISNEYDIDWYQNVRNEYYYICGSSPGSFVTVIGTLLMDFSQKMIAFLMIAFSVFFTTFFRTASNNRLSTVYMEIIFAHFILFSTIGLLYSSVPGNIQMLVTILFYFVLRSLEQDDLQGECTVVH